MQKDRKRKYWGWGRTDFEIDKVALEKSISMLEMGLGTKATAPLSPRPIEELSIPTPRFELTPSLSSFCSDDAYIRANHTYGKAYRDVWRALRAPFDHAPDYVAFPSNEEEITEIYEFAGERNIAVIPYGGGSSVVGGIEPRFNKNYNGCISVDMQNFDQLLEVDRESRSVKLQAGMYGPAVEKALRPHGYTLRHYPQSFEFSTLGGWIATHAGGHFATMYTHIDDFVQSIKMVSPSGVIFTRRLPGSGAGPDDNHAIMGSEGIYGIITEAWMRVQELPKNKAAYTISFPSWESGVEACRLLSQSALFPSNARLISAFEAMFNNLGSGQDTLILGFESHEAPLEERVKAALQICRDQGGTWKEKTSESKKRSADADTWKKSFLQAPYMRDELVRYGFIVETFETCTTWHNFPAFHKAINQVAQAALAEVGSKGYVSCRFTHLYPDGPAPYYTIIASGSPDKQLEQWDTIKRKVSEALIEKGGTITHHHAVGRDHRPSYTDQHSDLYGNVLRSVKKTLDPNGIMNPGVLLDEDTVD